MAKKFPKTPLIVGIVAIIAVILIAGNAIGLPIPDFLGVSNLLVGQTPDITSTIYGENAGQATLLPGCSIPSEVASPITTSEGPQTTLVNADCSTGVDFDVNNPPPAPDELPPPVTTNQTAEPQPFLALIAVIDKIDSDGKIDSDKITLPFAQLSFVEQGLASDYSSGSIVIRSLAIQGEPLLNIAGVGTFDVLIANQTIFTMPHSLEIITNTGTLDGNGTAQVQFVDPTGVKNPVFTFLFVENLMQFPNFALTELKFVISDFVITTQQPCIAIVPLPPECEPKQFGISEGDLLTLVIDNDPSKTIIVDETTGENIVVNLADNNLVISTFPKTVAGPDCIVSPPLGDVFINIKGQPVEDRVIIFGATPEGTKTGTTCHPLVGETSTTTTLIQRNTVYVMEFTDPVVTFEFITPSAQMDYHFSCQYNGTSIVDKGLRDCNFPP